MRTSCQTASAVVGYGDTECMGLQSFRVGEAVAHGDDALDMPGLGHDLAAADRGLRTALEGDDAAGDGDREAVRVGEEPVEDHVLEDFRADLLVRAAVDAQHVGPA